MLRLRLRLRLRLGLGGLGLCLLFQLFLTFSGGWVVGGVVGEVRDKAISSQVVVEVDIGVELGNKLL